ncbi:hypothetical protein GCM10028820_19420 [Tessaracoccus terricola]
MGLFRPYERTEKTSSTKRLDRVSLTPKTEQKQEPQQAAEAAPDEAGTGSEKIVVSRQPQKKSAPTRTRKQAEAERMERLHPTLTPKEQRKKDRAARAEAQAEAFDRQERSPERVLLRNFVDSRWTINEFMLPAMILIMAAVMLTTNNLALSSSIALGLWVLMGAAVINTFFMWRSFKKILDERLPGTPKRGLLMYMFNRALMIRRFRRPTPVIPRGGFE